MMDRHFKVRPRDDFTLTFACESEHVTLKHMFMLGIANIAT